MADFYDLEEWQPTAEADVKLSKAIAILKAIQENNDFRLLACQRYANNEALIVDVTCSDVPNRNPVGIRPRERIAITIFASDQFLPAVLMLRKGFPSLMHMNGTVPNFPRELCLYFEPTRSVSRSWTAPQFLRRIQWWLFSTANGILHVADQPLELPFFNSGWELVLPPGFEALRSTPNQRFRIQRAGAIRHNEVATLRVIPATQVAQDTWGMAIFNCNPLVHGVTINVPETLGSLADDLQTRGVEFIAHLRSQLIENLAEGGEKLSNTDNRFAIVVELPIVRQVGGPIERIQRIAFLLHVGRLDLGFRVGAYIKHNDIFYRFQEIGGLGPQEGNWRSLTILPAAVLNATEPPRLREYSGIEGSGPASGVLVGAGALGSALVDMWSRGGWGTWTVVDSDHVKPHNIARHRAYDGAIGEFKADFVRELSEAVSPPGVVKKSLVCDACDATNEDLKKVFDTADVVLDCSTTLDFPRLASIGSSKARHASAFITPSGRDSVLIVEDVDRTYRLNSLEAQYYRALINKPWGMDHLKGNLSTFWSGASCRDISVKLEYAAVLGHAATINRQLRTLLDSPEADIRVWIRNESTGMVQAHRIPVYKPLEGRVDGLLLRYDERFIRRLYAMRQQFLPKETGGIVLGYFDLNLGELVLVDCLPPPPDSVHSSEHFIRGVHGVQEAVADAQARTANVVGYVGEWHSHPPGHSANPSRDDFIQLHKLSETMAHDGLPILQVIVGENEVGFKIFGEVLR